MADDTMRLVHEPMTEHMSIECELLFEHLRDVVFFIRASDGRILTVNHAAEALYGRTSAELQTMRIYDIIALPKDEPSPPDATRGNLITEEGTLFESFHLRRDGSKFPVEASARLATIDGEPTIIAVVRDITDRVEAQRALRRAYDEIEQVFETAAEGMRIVDNDFTVSRMNRTLAEMTGLSPGEAVGMKCYESFSGATCHTEHCPVALIRAGAGELTYEVEKANPLGDTYSCILHAQPFLVDGEIVGIVESFRDITDRKSAEDLARHLATHDALTGLPNRLLFTDRLEVALARSRRDGTRPALLFSDVDHFKEINDARGHAAGDEALKSIARSLSAAVREVDSVARLGGDEFVVLISTIKSASGAESVARKIVDSVRALPAVDSGSVPLSLSIGIALCRLDDTVDTFLNRADGAMYMAKERGGDGYHVADGDAV